MSILGNVKLTLAVMAKKSKSQSHDLTLLDVFIKKKSSHVTLGTCLLKAQIFKQKLYLK